MSVVGVETVGLIDPWLWEVLSTDPELAASDAGGRVIGTQAPGKIALPYILWIPDPSPRQIRGVGTTAISVEAIYTVKVVGQGSSWSQVTPIYQRVHALIDGVLATRAEGSLSCVRDLLISYPEMVEGVQYRHLGGSYRIRASAH